MQAFGGVEGADAGVGGAFAEGIFGGGAWARGAAARGAGVRGFRGARTEGGLPDWGGGEVRVCWVEAAALVGVYAWGAGCVCWAVGRGGGRDGGGGDGGGGAYGGRLAGLDAEASERVGAVGGDGGGGADGVGGEGVQGGRGASGGGGEGGEAGVQGGVCEEGGKLRVDGDGAFVLEVEDFAVKAFDLAVELGTCESLKVLENHVRVCKLTSEAAFSLRATFSSWMA